MGQKTYSIQNLKQYRMSQVITELNLKDMLNHRLKIELKISWLIQREIKGNNNNNSNNDSPNCLLNTKISY